MRRALITVIEPPLRCSRRGRRAPALQIAERFAPVVLDQGAGQGE